MWILCTVLGITPPHILCKTETNEKSFVYIHNETLLSCKDRWYLAICNYLDGARWYYLKWNN